MVILFFYHMACTRCLLKSVILLNDLLSSEVLFFEGIACKVPSIVYLQLFWCLDFFLVWCCVQKVWL
jgi:hypothetical protein